MDGNGGPLDDSTPRFRLLVVDDEPAIREATHLTLSERGHEVMTAQDGLEALALVPRFRPHLIITDLRMPGMSGFELVKAIRERYLHLPIIVVSGEFVGDEKPSDVMADCFLPKGSSQLGAKLTAKVEELLSGVSHSPDRRQPGRAGGADGLDKAS